jgi:hypothetical protein
MNGNGQRGPGAIVLWAEIGDSPMNPSEEFLRHAAECESMAKFARDPQSKATWNHMAQRWVRCAELFTKQTLAAQHAPAAKRHHRRPAPEAAHP